MENKTAEEIFCKVYTEFYGEPIDKAEQITEHRFNGNELMEFCEFYASQQLAEKDKEIESYMSLLDDASKTVVERDKEIERLKKIILSAIGHLEIEHAFDALQELRNH